MQNGENKRKINLKINLEALLLNLRKSTLKGILSLRVIVQYCILRVETSESKSEH